MEEKIINIVRKNKGSLKDPVICLGIISVILFGLITFGASSGMSLDKKSMSPMQNDFSGGDSKAFIANVSAAIFDPVFQGQGGIAQEDVLADFSLVQNTSLIGNDLPISPWLWFEGSKEITEYQVQDGDNIKTIAENFGISQETILWANNLGKNSIIKAGQELVILPVSGAMHRVNAGDTLSEIAKKYKGDVSRILAFNESANENDITIGDILIIPDGVMPAAAKIYVPQVPLANNYFIFPTVGRITQGLHFYNAVDIANECGTPIYAAAQGSIIKVNMTESTSIYANKGSGSYIKILHPNNTTTYYGHAKASFVSVGDQVSQGQIIALMGGKPGTPGAGRSTGCHTHFEVGGARNPFAFLGLGALIGY